MAERFYVDIHVIETLPPSCVNRDDTGSPKTAIYGGVTRARVSSQAWKRAMREEFKEMLSETELGKRTKHLPDLVAKEIERAYPEFESKADALAREIIAAGEFKLDKNKPETSVLQFVSPAQVRALARLAVENQVELESKAAAAKAESKEEGKKKKKGALKEKVLQALKENPSFDIALFGRMVAEAPDLKYDAAAQVAHAISTHEVHNDFDYFTAVDDWDGVVGAGHIGLMEFNSATLYRYATVNVQELQKHFCAEIPQIIRCFAEAFICSMPTGKQNSYANGVRPDAVYVTVRRDRPVNMAGAFEKPVVPGKDGYAKRSVSRLADYAKETYALYYSEPEFKAAVGKGAEQFAEPMSLSELLQELEKHVADKLSAGGLSAGGKS